MTEALINLLPKPKVPAFEDVHRNALRLGGTEEMAEAFYNKWDAVGWYKVNPTQPIMNYVPLLQMFISNWKQNDQQRSKSNQNWGGF